jgi:hypothetical protein
MRQLSIFSLDLSNFTKWEYTDQFWEYDKKKQNSLLNEWFNFEFGNNIRSAKFIENIITLKKADNQSTEHFYDDLMIILIQLRANKPEAEQEQKNEMAMEGGRYKRTRLSRRCRTRGKSGRSGKSGKSGSFETK